MRGFKVVVFGLLALNLAIYFSHASLAEALDQLGWVILLAVFLYETSARGRDRASPLAANGLRAALVVGYGLAILACGSYWAAGDALGFLNSVTWLAVCVVLAYDLYAPAAYGGAGWRARKAVKIALYAALVVYVAISAVEGVASESGLAGLLDAYDAALWIVCFVVIERDVFARETKGQARARPAPSS